MQPVRGTSRTHAPVNAYWLDSFRVYLANALLVDDLVGRGALALMRHTQTHAGCDGRGNVHLTDNALGGAAFLNAGASCDEDRAGGGVALTEGRSHGVVMVMLVTLSHAVDDIAALGVLAAETQRHSILATQSPSDDALAGLLVLDVVQIGDDLLLELILIGGINQTVDDSAVRQGCWLRPLMFR